MACQEIWKLSNKQRIKQATKCQNITNMLLYEIQYFQNVLFVSHKNNKGANFKLESKREIVAYNGRRYVK